MKKEPKTIIDLADIARHKMAFCYYTKAEKVLRHIHSIARDTGNRNLQFLTSEAINECRRRHILGVFRCLACFHQPEHKGVKS